MSAREGRAFNRGTVLGLVVFGFAAFLAMLYFISTGDTGDRSRGEAHAAADGLNGYSGLVRLLELEDWDVTISRERSELDTTGLLVVSPPTFADPEAIGELLEERRYTGPTMIILPKWFTTGFPNDIPPEIEDAIEDDWVRLFGVRKPNWAADLPAPFAIEIEQLGTHTTEGVIPLGAIMDEAIEGDEESADEASGDSVVQPTEPAQWAGLELRGVLPTKSTLYAVANSDHRALILDEQGGALAIELDTANSEIAPDEYYSYPIYVIVEPDLANNMGLSDPVRAEATLRLFDQATSEYDEPIIFDVTLNGLGASTNLLTLAFRPPFLAATLCLLFAMLIIGWRSFNRFGPAAAAGPKIAFGKHRLVANGADLIVRARRMSLLTEPYAALSARRLAHRLGISSQDPQALDAALAGRLNQPNLFSMHKQALIQAGSAKDIVSAARALRQLEGKIER
jgi:hypothetical protein